jgi:hypothetical protein
MELIEKRKAEPSLPDSEWFGEEGKAYKVEKGTKKKAGVDNSVTVKILGESTTVDDFGTTYIYRMVTPEGHLMTWFASNSSPVWGEQQHYIGVGDTIKPASQTSAPHDLRRPCARLCHLSGGEQNGSSSLSATRRLDFDDLQAKSAPLRCRELLY